ncbi:MAG TPA: glycosyltransferase family 4 protein [Anaerolineales bacterium]|nr:glycosyltransferase family 4 protein [Anaerolineales bacterium]
MHILLIHQAFASLDEPGGTRHHELSRYLGSRGQRVSVIASPISYLTGLAREEQRTKIAAEQAGEGVTVKRVYTYPAFHRSFAHRVISFLSFMLSSFFTGLRAKQVDLIWGTSPPIFQGVTAWALARLKGVPFLFEVRDLWPAFAVAVGVLRQPTLVRVSEWLESFLYSRADVVVVNSPGFIAHVQARGAKKVALVPNGSDTLMFDPLADGSEFRKAHGLQDKFVVLYAGAHGMSNDLGVLLEAAQMLKPREDILIVLLGAGKEKPSLIRQAESLNLDNVIFLPPVAKADMCQALAAADACIAILKPVEMYKTVYPNKVFDYMAAGRPVILAIDGVIREVVEESGAGIAVPPGDPGALRDAIISLADDRPAGKAMGMRGRQQVEDNFDRAVLAEKMLATMQALVTEED